MYQTPKTLFRTALVAVAFGWCLAAIVRPSNANAQSPSVAGGMKLPDDFAVSDQADMIDLDERVGASWNTNSGNGRIIDREQLVRHCQGLLGVLESAARWEFQSDNQIPNANWSERDDSGRPAHWCLFDGHGIEVSTVPVSDDSFASRGGEVCLQIKTFAPRHWPDAPCGCVRTGVFAMNESRRLAVASCIEMSDAVEPADIRWTLRDAKTDEALPMSVRHQPVALERPGDSGRVMRFTAESDLSDVAGVSHVYLQWQLFGGGQIRLSDLRTHSDLLSAHEIELLKSQTLDALADLKKGRFSTAEKLLVATDWERLSRIIEIPQQVETEVSPPKSVASPMSDDRIDDESAEGDAIVIEPPKPIHQEVTEALAMERLSPALSRLGLPTGPGPEAGASPPAQSSPRAGAGPAVGAGPPESTVASDVGPPSFQPKNQPEGLSLIGDFGPSEEAPRVSVLTRRKSSRPTPVTPSQTTAAALTSEGLETSDEVGRERVEPRRGRRTLFDLLRNRYRREHHVPSQRASTDLAQPTDKGS